MMVEFRAADLMKKTLNMVRDSDAWLVEPLGHTEFQIRNLMLNPREYPTNDSRYRQIVRELWARRGAGLQLLNELDRCAPNRRILESEIEEKKATLAISFLPWRRKKLKAEIELKELEVALLNNKEQELRWDLEHRVIRETLVLMDEAGKVKPDKENPRLTVEENNWNARCRENPKLLTGGK